MEVVVVVIVKPQTNILECLKILTTEIKVKSIHRKHDTLNYCALQMIYIVIMILIVMKYVMNKEVIAILIAAEMSHI